MTRLVTILTALLAVAGAQQTRWAYRYDGPASGYDLAYSLAIGPDSNLYAAGFSSSGSGELGRNLTVIGLTRGGTERWIYRHDSTSHAREVAVGPDSNLYVAGMTRTAETANDFAVISLTPGGTERWTYTYRVPGLKTDEADAMAVAPDGIIYAAGLSDGGSGGSLFTVISLAPDGVERWVYSYNGPGDGYDKANSVVVGPDGHIYAAGYSGGIGTRDDITVISLTRDGTERWVYRYNGPANLRDQAFAITVGPDSNLYVAGMIRGMRSTDFGVISLTPAGTERWVYGHNGPGEETDAATSIAVGPDGNVYAGGTRANSSSNYDFTVISLDSDGEERWMYTHGGTARASDGVWAIALGPGGSIYASGYVTNDRTRQDFTVVNLSSTGIERWIHSYDGPGNNSDDGLAVTLGPDGFVYAAGYSGGIGTNADFTVLSVDPAGAVAEPDPMPGRTGFVLRAGGIRGRALDYTLHLPEPAMVRLSLFDRQGRKLDGWQVSAPAGISRQARSLPSVAAGVYFLTAEIPGHRAGAKVIRTAD